MTDPIDKKSKEKRDNLDVDLDAMLDQAESSLLPRDEFQDDDDAIDRLLMDAGFDSDDAMMPSKAKTDADLHDELDDFLDFDDFGDDFNIPEKPLAAAEELGGAVGGAPDFSLNDSLDEEDAIDRLLMNAQLDADDSDQLDELDVFSDFSDFTEPDLIQTDEPKLAADSLSAFTDDTGATNKIDAVDKPDRGSEEVETSAPAMAAVNESDLEVGAADTDEELDPFSDFSDFVEPDPIPAIDEPEQVAENLSANDEQGLQDEIDDFFSLGGFDESDLIQDDQVKSPLAAETEPEQAQPTAFEPLSDNADLSDEIDDFSNFGSLDQSDSIQDEQVKPPIPTETEINRQQSAEPERSSDNNAGLPDEIDDFFSQGGFDGSDMIEDDVESSTPAKAEAGQEQQAESSGNESAAFPDEFDDLFNAGSFDESDMIQDDEVPVKVEPQAAVEPFFSAESADEMDDFFNLGGFDESDMIEDDVESSTPAKAEADQEQQAESSGNESAAFPDEFDDLFSAGGFDESDLLQDDDVETSDPLPEVAPDQGQQVGVEQPFSDLQNDENSFDSLFMDSDFNETDALEQAVEKKDEFGDDTDLSEIDEFFQLDEVSDDFSKETGGAALAGGEQSIQDEDDFLLPDFDITADMELSDMGSNSGTKTDDLADAFGDSDFLDEDDVMQTFKPEMSELKPGDDDSVFESQPKQAADAVPENAKNSSSASGQGDVKKQLEDAERKVKKAKLFAYIALGFGTVALSAAAGLGVMTYNAKSEVSKLTETVSTLEASLAKNTENTPKEEINAVMDSVVQLNQKVYGFITELKGNPQSLAELLNSKVPDIAAKQDMVSKALDILQTKVGGEGRMPLLESLVNIPIKTEVVQEPAPAKIEPAQEHAPSKVSEAHPSKEKNAHEAAPTKERAKHEEASAKAEPIPEAAPVKAKTQEEAEPVKPIIPPKAILKKEESVKISEPTTVGKWGVNLAAFKQEWFAKSKAAEFARQGIFAEVIPVYERNTTMYRLRVGGFRTKAEANANTARIKQALNLDSVWVSDN